MNYYPTIGLGVFVILIGITVAIKNDKSIEVKISHAVSKKIVPLEPIIETTDLETAIKLQKRAIKSSDCSDSLKSLKENHIILMESQQQTTGMLDEALQLKAVMQTRIMSFK